jgi:LysR family transcriptional regulator, regulator of abg operon
MKLHHIRDVVAVAEHGSLRSASRHLNLAQPAITRSIRELEHELGAMLFERRSKGMILTPMGEAFVRRARGIQFELQRAREEIEQLKGASSGTVSIALSTAPHIALLPRVIDPFRRRFPDVKLKVIEGLFPSLESDLQDGVLDFYIGPVMKDVSGELLVEKLFDNRRIVVGRIGHPLSFATSLAELTSAQWAVSTLYHDSDVELYPAFELYDLPRPHIAAQGETALSTMVMVSSSDLLSMLPQQWSEFVAQAGNLQQIHIQEVIPAPPICLARLARLPLTPAAELLCDLFRRAALHHVRRLAANSAGKVARA